MKKMSTYLIAAVAAILFGISNVSAAERDDGTDHNGKFILSETLARRCGLSSQAPDITEDCIRRLAYDRETDTPIGFFNFNLVDSIFGSVIGISNYDLRIDITGTIKDDKVIFE